MCWLPKTNGLKTALVGSGVPVSQCRAESRQRIEAWKVYSDATTNSLDYGWGKERYFAVAPGWQPLGRRRCQVAWDIVSYLLFSLYISPHPNWTWTSPPTCIFRCPRPWARPAWLEAGWEDPPVGKYFSRISSTSIFVIIHSEIQLDPPAVKRLRGGESRTGICESV